MTLPLRRNLLTDISEVKALWELLLRAISSKSPSEDEIKSILRQIEILTQKTSVSLTKAPKTT
ncbi:hypothetical protein JW962_03690 [Candidatus Dojkabacteria bacterium]|nr:hypothetical protein [Candidatus Dojkabacteria bacterium]